MEVNAHSQNKLYWVYLIGFFLILALPLLNLPPWFSPPDWGKTIVFRIVLSILIFLFIYQLLFQKNQVKKSAIAGILCQRKKSKAFLPLMLLIALLGIYFLAAIFSLDIRFSLWGSPYRSGGFVNFAFCIILAILMFFILDKKDWQKIWIFAIIVGVLVSIIAVFQQFGILSEIFVPQATQLGSTIGGPMFLGVYLLLLSFLTLSFCLAERGLKKKIFYFLALTLFFFVILLTTSQASYLGMAIGFLWFLFFYPKKITLLKIIAGALLLLGIFSAYFLKTHPEISINQNYVVSSLLSWEMDESRVSSWKVSLEAVKARPILGYGPENFNIGFDKYYDPSLPKIDKHTETHSSWWDRAHNFIFDIAITAGIPALIIYLSLVLVLFWELQKLKKKNPEQSLVYHGIQATFIGYLAANFFGFDTFSGYLISFLLIGYSLFLIYKRNVIEEIKPENRQKQTDGLWKFGLIFILFLILIWFVWSFNIKPFQINTQLNIAKYQIANKECEQAFARMDNILARKSFLNNYLRLKYIDFMMNCQIFHPEKNLEYAKKGVPLLKENIKTQPYYVRNWILLAGFMSVLIDNEPNPETQQKLIEEAGPYFEKAHELSPKRQEVFIEWCKYGLVSNKYQLMKESSQQCIDVNANLSDCYWFKGLSEISLGNLEIGKENLKIAEEKGYAINALVSLIQLAKAHSMAKNYQELVEVYQKLISLNPKEPQYHATLAFIYKELGDYQKAREEAMIVLELQPETREMVDEFLESLPY